MSLLSIAKGHFQNLLKQQVLKYITVPQWQQEGKPIKIFFQALAALTVKQFSEISELAKKGRVEDFVDILILRCCDEQGKALFNKSDRLELLHHVSPQVICKILAQMGDVDDSLDKLDSLEKKPV